MLVRETFVIRPKNQRRLDLELPLRAELGAGNRAELWEAESEVLQLVIERPVDLLRLTIEKETGFYEQTS